MQISQIDTRLVTDELLCRYAGIDFLEAVSAPDIAIQICDSSTTF
jgi:hypothetical protein